jgi:ketosteroid isomerase-like protein
MSEENVEVARQVMEAYNRGDRDAWFRLHDPELEFRAAPVWPESGLLRGREQAWDFVASLNDAWEESDFEMVEVIDQGDKVVARVRRPVRGKQSGIVDVLDQWSVITIGGGKVLRQEFFTSRAEALQAAGLSE